MAIPYLSQVELESSLTFWDWDTRGWTEDRFGPLNATNLCGGYLQLNCAAVLRQVYWVVESLAEIEYFDKWDAIGLIRCLICWANLSAFAHSGCRMICDTARLCCEQLILHGMIY